MPWSSLEVGEGYRSGDAFGNGTIGLGGFGTAVRYTDGEISTVRQFAKIARKSSMADSCESHMLLGTSMSTAEKKCMSFVILSSAVTLGCVSYSCKYSYVSVISNVFVLLSITWMQR